MDSYEKLGQVVGCIRANGGDRGVPLDGLVTQAIDAPDSLSMHEFGSLYLKPLRYWFPTEPAGMPGIDNAKPGLINCLANALGIPAAHLEGISVDTTVGEVTDAI